MDARYHVQICHEGLSNKFSKESLATIIRANLRQDGIFTGILGHPEYHFDGPKIEQSYLYLISQMKLILENLEKTSNVNIALQAFGKYLHCVQDFYAHSNYVSLWTEQYGTEAIDGNKQELLNSDEIICGKVYYPLEAITYFEIFRPFARKILPQDSHANMNLDNPSRGVLFLLAMEAATQRTSVELLKIESQLSPKQKQLFKGTSHD